MTVKRNTKNGAAMSSTQNASPELLMSSVLYLMSHYSVQARQQNGAETRLAQMIERHLALLAESAQLAPVIRATCEQLLKQWQELTEKTPAGTQIVSESPAPTSKFSWSWRKSPRAAKESAL